MALTYDQVYNLRNTGWVRNRTIVAIGHYADFLSGLGGSATVDQQAFVARVLPGKNAEIEADYIAWAVINDAVVQAANLDGSGITDAQIQSVTESHLTSLGRVKAV